MNMQQMMLQPVKKKPKVEVVMENFCQVVCQRHNVEKFCLQII
jgi:hypothetical protein